MFPLNFKYFIFLTNEVVSCKCDGSFYAAAFKNESIHSGNCFVHKLDPPQIVISMFPLSFKFFIFLTNEVVPCKCDGSFYNAAFKNESIHSGNCFVHELDPPQIVSYQYVSLKF